MTFFYNHNIEIVIHLAAKAGIRPSISDPYGYYQTNIVGTLNILEAMRQHGVNRMIFASSSSVYGNNEKVPFSEQDHVDFPISPHAATKKAGELLCHTYHHLYGFYVFCLRFFNVYGPRQLQDLAIHKFTSLIMNNQPVPIYGDGSTSRDYTYIYDIVAGVINSIQILSGFQIINLGESKVISLSHMIKVLEKHIGKQAKLVFNPMQPGDVLTTFADISKAKMLINYNPNWDFEDGIKQFIKWKKS